MRPVIPLFWTSGDYLVCVLCHQHTMDSSDSSLVQHLMTSSWPRWQLSHFIHILHTIIDRAQVQDKACHCLTACDNLLTELRQLYSNVNPCPIPDVLQGHTQMDILLVYTTCAYWKVGVYHNVTLERTCFV